MHTLRRTLFELASAAPPGAPRFSPSFNRPGPIEAVAGLWGTRRARGLLAAARALAVLQAWLQQTGRSGPAFHLRGQGLLEHLIDRGDEPCGLNPNLHSS